MNIRLAFSTCPNDTFMFDALVNNRIDHSGFSFDVILADIQELNTIALKSEAELVKISYALYPYISENYQLLTAGSAMGRGVGPLVISRRKIYPDEVKYCKIAIPGEHTTANMLFSFAFPDSNQKSAYLFSDIEDAVLANEVDVGVIIHENRFTYQNRGLRKIIDLGEYWEGETKQPIPLGCIAVRRDLPQEIKTKLNQLTRKSVEYALKNPTNSYPYVKIHAQSMEEEIIEQHINLYVNQYSIDLGEDGRKAALNLFQKYEKLNYAQLKQLKEPIYAV